MDAIAEIFMEILGELVLEGGVSAASDHRRPKWLRVLILTLMALFFAAVFALMAAGGIIMLKDGKPIAGVLMLALDLALVVLSVYSLRKILRTFSRR